jgi:hypothetical protein
MGTKNILSLSVFILVLISVKVYPQVDISSERTGPLAINSDSIKYGALAIDRGNGIYYGWASDCSSLAEAEERAIKVCKGKGGQGTIVLSFSGAGCAAYRFITGNVGMGYGWGVGKTKEEADVKAKKECAERSYGLPAPNIVWICNSANSGELKEIYNAHDEINAIQPGIITNY